MTILEAKNEVVFYTENGSVIESNLLDYLEEFGQSDNTTEVEESEKSIYKVGGEEFESYDDALDYCKENGLRNDLEESNIEEVIITNYSHVERYSAYYGRKIISRQDFGQDQEAAEASYIQGLKWFVSEKNWDAPQYFSSYDEAECYRIESAAEGMGVDADVFKSIEKKQKLVKSVREERAAVVRAKNEAEKNFDFEMYKNIISRIDPETYKQTEARLAAALPVKISGSVFHQIVKKIRK